MSSFDVRKANLRAINSMTKYPSIPTYHTLNPRDGSLTDEVVKFEGLVYGTEKVDGTNARVIWLPDGSYLIGSREELLYAEGDLIGNPSQRIVAALRESADGARRIRGGPIAVHYFEVYGGKVTAGSKQYTRTQQVGFQLFDVACLDYDAMKDWDTERISAWRDRGGQEFVTEDELINVAVINGFDLMPRLFIATADELPTDIEKMHALLSERLPHTFVALDGEPGRAEGIVLRTPDRSVIAKARFQDYERTLKRRRSGGAQ